MSRTQSQGIKFFPMDVGFFNDNKIKILKMRYGADGVLILIYLFTQIYNEGYYVRFDEDFKTVMSIDLNISIDTIEQVIAYLLGRSMFDEQLAKSAEVLTSRGIQERWIKAIKSRALKTPVKVENYWLLKESETPTFIHCTLFDDNSTKKDFNSTQKEDTSTNYAHKVKKSKVNNPPYIPPLPKGGRKKRNNNVSFANARTYSEEELQAMITNIDDVNFDNEDNNT